MSSTNFLSQKSLIRRKYLRPRRDNLSFDDSETLAPQNYTDAHVEGLRVETAEKEPTHSEEGIPEIRAGTKAVIRLFGTGITPDTLIAFTDIPADRGTVCDKIKSNEFPVSIHEACARCSRKMKEKKKTLTNLVFRWKM